MEWTEIHGGAVFVGNVYQFKFTLSPNKYVGCTLEHQDVCLHPFLNEVGRIEMEVCIFLLPVANERIKIPLKELEKHLLFSDS